MTHVYSTFNWILDEAVCRRDTRSLINWSCSARKVQPSSLWLNPPSIVSSSKQYVSAPLPLPSEPGSWLLCRLVGGGLLEAPPPSLRPASHSAFIFSASAWTESMTCWQTARWRPERRLLLKRMLAMLEASSSSGPSPPLSVSSSPSFTDSLRRPPNTCKAVKKKIKEAKRYAKPVYRDHPWNQILF